MLVFGGSQGARSINQAAVEAFAGAALPRPARRRRARLPDLTSPGPHYDLRGYISDFGEALLASDLVVARSGGSVFEIAAHGRPMVLIPYPHATADHQTANARFMERAGAAVVIPDAELDAPPLAAGGGRLLGRPGRLAAMAARRGAGPAARGAEIAGECCRAAGPVAAAAAAAGRARLSTGRLGKPGPSCWLACAPRPGRAAGQNTPPGGPPPQPLVLPGGWVHMNASA